MAHSAPSLAVIFPARGATNSPANFRRPMLRFGYRSIRQSSRAPDFFKIPQDAIIEVGFQVEI
jgi:hypothetical protein